jgi:beta-galactosidase
VLGSCGVSTVLSGLPEGVEVVRRHDGASDRWLFVINHSDQDVVVPVTGRDLLTGAVHRAATPVTAGGVVVMHESRDTQSPG